MILTLLACGAGLYLGLHFNILALLPFSVLGAGAFIVSSWSAGETPMHSAGLIILPLIGVQAGYFLGLIARETYGNLIVRLKLWQSRQA
ncbi:hypothetical protein [Bradyrhizobium lablabi]|uniref:hypothetical protein n=1 Tax=Bradyrhizobium lablabi TaxID=722472 RepID=UPI001BABC80A|nr:hypothetical protein [Bradyrhizobium lablabi]MBR0697755.1 hypothetical protein [Bradyrhizobium lablabi]